MLADTRDTIVAIATAAGVGAIGIVRISGPQARAVFERVFRPAHTPLSARRMHFGHAVDPTSGTELDEALGWFAPAPHTFTGEDTAEIQGHGGPVVLRAVVNAAVAAGCRLAEPGEFTRRAFACGRIDLSRAEAIANLVGATTETAARVARSQLEGGLAERVGQIRADAIEVLAQIEAAVDYPEEPIAPDGGEALASRLDALAASCEALVATWGVGHWLVEGARVALVGRPNVGKSSLLNALLERDRAIVTPEAGTTRDVVEATLSVGGVPVTLLDTAGVRGVDEAGSAAEAEGVRRSREAMTSADRVLFVLDGAEPITSADRELAATLPAERTLVTVNKSDLPAALEDAAAHALVDIAPLHVSARTGDGLDGLRTSLERSLTGGAAVDAEGVVLTAARHRDAMGRAAQAFGDAMAGIRAQRSPELPASDVRAGLDALAAITGETTPEDVLDVIFSRFCIGK